MVDTVPSPPQTSTFQTFKETHHHRVVAEAQHQQKHTTNSTASTPILLNEPINKQQQQQHHGATTTTATTQHAVPTQNGNKTDSYSYSYTYKKADDTGNGIPGLSTVEVNETVTEEIGPDGTKIIRRHQQEKQINKVTQVVTQRVIKRQYIDPLTGKILEYDPTDERFVNLPPETVFEEHTIRSNDDDDDVDHHHHHHGSPPTPLMPSIKIPSPGSVANTTSTHAKKIVKLDVLDANRQTNGTSVTKNKIVINSNQKSNLHPEDNQGYPEEKNMDYDPDDVNYQDDPQYEGLIPDTTPTQTTTTTSQTHKKFLTSQHTHTNGLQLDNSTYLANKYNSNYSNVSLSNSGDYVSNHYADASSAYTYIGLGYGNGTLGNGNGNGAYHTPPLPIAPQQQHRIEDMVDNGRQRHLDDSKLQQQLLLQKQQQQQQQQLRNNQYATITQQQLQNESIYDYGGLESHYGTFSPGQQQRNFISRHQLLQQQQDQLDQRTRSPSIESRIRVEQGWRNPELEEVIEFLSHPSQEIRSNACAYLQHLCYQDDHIKTRTRQLGGIQKLIQLINIEQLNTDVYRNACGALRNLSYGRLNDENKLEIKKSAGIVALVRLLKRTQDELTRENITAVLWNLSSCEEIKMGILDEGLPVLVQQIIIPYTNTNNFNLYQKFNSLNVNGNSTSSGNARYKYDTNYPIVLTNTTGILRNCSSTLQFSNCDARKKLRDSIGLIEALIKIIDNAIEPFLKQQTSQQQQANVYEQEQSQMNLDSKCIENCCCILRNLSFRLQEIIDPSYDRDVKIMPYDGVEFTIKKKKIKKIEEDFFKNTYPYNMKVPVEGKSQELLWNLQTISKYLIIIKESTIRDTIEACIGCIQNLTACYWLPSQQIRQEVRKLKGLPTLVYLLQSDKVDDEPIVSVTAIALRNLAIDLKNRELIGKYAMKALIAKLPDPKKPVPQRLNILNEDTITAALACINECAKSSDEFAKSCHNEGGSARMIFITRNGQTFPPKIVKYAAHVLLSLWKHKNLHDLYKKEGFKEQDFTQTAKQMGIKSHNSSPVNTLHRPRGDVGMKLSYNSTQNNNTNKSKQRTQQKPAATPTVTSTHIQQQPQQNNFNTLKQMNDSGISDVALYSQVQKQQQQQQNGNLTNRSLIITNGTTNADSWV